MVYLTAAALLASGLVASVLAENGHHQIHGHVHNKNHAPAPQHDAKANATTCDCTTYTTTWYGEPTMYMTHLPLSTTSEAVKPTSEPPKPAPPVYAPPKEKEQPKESPKPAPPPAPQPAPQPEQPKEAPKPEQPKEAPAPAPAVEAPKQPSSSGGISPNGNKWAMTYTPYRSDGQCKTASEVNDDIGSIKSMGFSSVRIYATDCAGPQNVGDAAKAHGMKMILGVFIDAKGLGAAHEQVHDLTNWGKSGNCWSMVEMVVVGNEAIFGGFTTAPELAKFITEAKNAFKAAGFSGPVTTTETLNIIQENAATLCPVVDVIGANLHPFFNGQHTAAEAGELVAQQLQDLSDACGGKLEAYNLETGWPSQGRPNGVAIPGKAEQEEAIRAIVAKVGSKSVIFSFEDDTWKAPGAYSIEQFWGCGKLFTN